MTEYTPFKFELNDGLPPDGEPGQFFGFDARGNACILRWHKGHWHGVRLVDEPRLLPEAFSIGPNDPVQRVVKWAAGPVIWADDLPPPPPKLQVVR